MNSESNNMVIPEWVENDVSLSSGQDLLGLRNSSQTIGNYCLNGITTITPRVRYLGIRAWSILMYNKCGLPDSYSSFLDFAYNLEAAIAIGSVAYKPDIKGVVGITEASNILESSNSHIKMKRLVKQPITRMYTQPSIHLGICFPRHNGITGITTERGDPLVQTIMDRVKDTSLVQSILNKKMVNTFTLDELKEIGELLSIENIPEKEREQLTESLIPSKPRPSGWKKDIMRLASYTLLLQLAKNNQSIPKSSDFFKVVINPDSKFDKNLKTMLNGWLCFLIRDSMTVCHERALETIVVELTAHDKKRMDRDRVVQNILGYSDYIDEKLIKVGVLKKNESFLDLRFLDIYNRIKNTIGKNKSLEHGLLRWDSTKLNESILIDHSLTREKGTVGLLPIAWILAYIRTKEGIDTEYDTIKMLSRGGWGRIGLKDDVIPAIEEWKTINPKYSKIVADMISRTVDQHVRICWSRMAVDMNKDVSVMVVDGNNWNYLKDFYTGRTAARLKEAIGWINQLKLIDKNGITSDGEIILNRGYQSLEQYYEGN